MLLLAMCCLSLAVSWETVSGALAPGRSPHARSSCMRLTFPSLILKRHNVNVHGRSCVSAPPQWNKRLPLTGTCCRHLLFWVLCHSSENVQLYRVILSRAICVQYSSTPLLSEALVCSHCHLSAPPHPPKYCRPLLSQLIHASLL